MTIPRTLHMIWVGPPFPARFRPCVASWIRLHPHWEFRMWGDATLGWIPNRDLYDTAARLVKPDAVEQFQADVARYAILERHGGLYVDVDTTCLRPVDDALDGHDAWAAAEVDGRWVGNTYLAAAPGHPVMGALVGRLPSHVAASRRLRAASPLSGPKYLTPIWRRHGCHVAPQRQWFPYGYAEARSGRAPTRFDSDVYAVHQFDHVRRVMAAKGHR